MCVAPFIAGSALASMTKTLPMAPMTAAGADAAGRPVKERCSGTSENAGDGKGEGRDYDTTCEPLLRKRNHLRRARHVARTGNGDNPGPFANADACAPDA